MRKLILLSFIIFCLIGISNTSANEYHSYYLSNNNSASITNPTIAISNIPMNEITLSLNAYDSFVSSGVYSATQVYRSPFSNVIATTSITGNGNNLCRNMGVTSKTNTNPYNLESLSVLSSSATSYYTRLRTNLDISTNQHNITFMNNGTKDSMNYIKNFLYKENLTAGSGAGGVPNVEIMVNASINDFNSNYSNCMDSNFQPKEWQNKSWVGGSTEYKSYSTFRLFVFNSSSGTFDYDVSYSGMTACINSATQIGYFEKGYNRTILSSTNTASGQLLLTPYATYGFYIASTGRCALSIGAYGNLYEGNYNATFAINIDEPDWICGDFGECENGLKTRLCVDSNGYFPNKIDTEVCYSLPDKSVNIGFEDSKNVNVFYSQPFWWIVGCLNYPAIKTVEYPNDWELNPVNHPYLISNATTGFLNINDSGYAYDDLAIVYDDSMEGIKSLKLWYIPPTINMVNCANMTDGASCEFNAYGNTTIGYFPKLQKDINETYMVSKDISFSYPNITITYYAKKCIEPVQSWAGNSTLLSLCGNGYYTNSRLIENVEPTDIFFSIYDYNSSSVIYDTKFNIAIPSWQKAQFRLINLDTSHLYRFEIGIMPKDYPVDTKSYCAYVDGLDMNAYTGSIPCNSHCGSVNAGELISSYYKASQTSDYGCSFFIEKVSPKCVGLIHTSEINSCNSFCSSCNSLSSDYLTYYEANNETGICEWNIITNSSYCSEYCMTQNIKEPNTVAETVNKLSLFLSPIFLIAFVILGIGAFLAYKTKSWQVLAIVVIVGFLIAGTVWIELAFISLCIIIVVAYFLAKEHGNPSGGK